ncbi:ABC transporter permease [Streptomyces yaizuensis]|uniref:Transport permease protein n=1 Tax=Streptomyces yaizuensis TaxID=2989713 RepID=A0ABQ5NRT0_9ACTN|nr:ABC transporter permease [Streptomyces sp. YSPA8]GLF93062.1 ABC transporter permease [Streptomyces sp. YSPA8]
MTVDLARRPPEPPPPLRGSLAATMYREYCLLTRDRTNLLLAIVPSAVYLLLFATSLANLVGEVRYGGRTVGYAEFTVPAVLLSSMLAAATTAGTSLFQERLGRMDVELWSYPLGTGGYVLGKLLVSTLLILAQTLAALVVALTVLDFRWPPGNWAAALCATGVAALAFNGLYLLLATRFSDFRRFSVTINVVAPVLLFSSPSFYPVDRMAPVLQWLSWANPVTYGIRAIRDGALFGFGAAWPWLLVLAGIAAVTGPLLARSLVARAREL